ncbi:unnamed protein product [Urochloa humidicola]
MVDWNKLSLNNSFGKRPIPVEFQSVAANFRNIFKQDVIKYSTAMTQHITSLWSKRNAEMLSTMAEMAHAARSDDNSAGASTSEGRRAHVPPCVGVGGGEPTIAAGPREPPIFCADGGSKPSTSPAASEPAMGGSPAASNPSTSPAVSETTMGASPAASKPSTSLSVSHRSHPCSFQAIHQPGSFRANHGSQPCSF